MASLDDFSANAIDPVAAPAALPQSPASVGKYGTPTHILDGLRHVESRGNQYAINTDSKAMGQYQFTPDTVATLHKKGIKFNPFEPTEARDAADQYITTLAKQNGGDYSKALAQYGGFKTKDPSKYISDVMKGGPVAASRAPVVKSEVDDFSSSAVDSAPVAEVTPTKVAPPAAVAAPVSMMDTLKQGAGNVLAGAVRGAGSLGETLLSPIDAAARAVNGGKPISVGGYEIAGHDRKTGMDQRLTEMGAQPNSVAFQAGKLGAEVAGTAGIGGVLAKGAKVLGAAPEVISALSSGGMSLGGGTTGSAIGNAALRGSSGGLTGALSAGAVDPSNATTGSAIGALTPGAAWLMGAAGKGIANGVGKVSSSILGGTTGTGSAVVNAAYNAGLKGDRSFIDNMRGNANFADIVDQAKSALSTMREARGAAYRNGMAAVSGDKTVLDMVPVQKAVTDAHQKFGTFNGQVVNENANAAISKVAAKVDEWAHLDPAQFHTPEGLDKLKQWVGGELENAKPGTQTDTALKGIYNSIKGTVATQAPTYAKTMADYSTASEHLSEISRTLSLNPKASIDTSVRKLQSVLRNNVATNFGNRLGNVEALESQAGANLVPAIAGQSMSSIWPRGMAGVGDLAALGAAGSVHPGALVGAVAASPRIVGEAAYKTGRLSSLMGAGGASNSSRYLPLNPAVPLLATQQPDTLQSLMSQLNVRRKTSP